MPRIPRDFSKREALEKKFILEDTWCDVCDKADLGMVHPVEFEEDGEVIVEGICARCGGPIRTTIIVKDIKEI
jgi:hypothetical protein